jgi:sugar lactone lactonase YvrE
MRRWKARFWVPILAASLFAACSPSSGSAPAAESAATPAEPATPAAGGAAPAIPVPTELVVETAIPGVVAAGTKIELIKTGFEGAEGPVGMPDGSVLFTETRASRITRIDPSGNISTFVEHSNEANGLGFDPQGRLIAVQRAPNNQKVSVVYPADKVAVLADSYDGKPFNRLNDIMIDKKGGVYFSDSIGENTGLYYIPPGGKAIRIFNETTNPNGMMLSRDEKTLYVNWEDGEYLLAFDVKPDGTLGPRRNFAKYESVKVPGHKDTRIAEGNGADGLAIDSEGRIYACTNRGIEVFSPQGQHLGTIRLVWGEKEFALRKPANLAFAGRDKKTLYVFGAASSAFKMQMLSQGFLGRAK